MVDVGFPETIGEIALQTALKAHGVDVAVLPGSRGVVGHLARGGNPLVAEFVLTARVGPLAVEGHAHALAELVFEEHRGVDQVERPRFERGLQVRLLARLELGPTGGEVDGTGRTELAGRLEYLTLLPVVERNLLDILEREFSQIHLAVLGIAQLDAVVIYTHVVGTHAADVDGLQTAHTAVILNLYTRKVAYGIGHRKAVEGLQLLAGEFLRGYHLAVPVGRDHHLAQRPGLYRVGLCRLVGPHPYGQSCQHPDYAQKRYPTTKSFHRTICF